jgi:endonuclease YncB( thermonuclease family)
MRKNRILGGVVVATIAAAAFVAGTLWPGTLWQGKPAPGPTETSAPIAELALPTDAPLHAAPPAEPAAPEPAPPAPAATALPKLATREVGVRPVHVVPENDPPPPPRPIDIRQAPNGAAESASRREPTRTAATRAPTPQVAGAAQASGATALLVGGRPFSLFGVRPPGTGDRCVAANGVNVGPAPPCAEKAHATLAARLARNPSVSCRLPAPTSAAAAAICLDAEGVDLGGLLVAEGLALADPSQSYDYVGAEQVARSQQRGLWRFR